MSNLNISSKDEQQFLPDFCALRIVFSVVIIGELFAIIVTLSSVGINTAAWDTLALSSLYIQWNGLLSIAFLCILRKFIIGYHRYIIASLSYIGLLLLFLLISEVTYNIIVLMHLQEMMSLTSRLTYHLHNVIIGGIISGIALRYLYIQHQWKLQIEAKAQTKLKLLQARIRPHFLFNSMNTIASLTHTNPRLAEEVTVNLADLFRVLFEQKQDLVTWDKELQIARQYLDIESLRFAQRLQINWQVNDMPNNALLPLLTLQPLLENAVYHGIEPSIEGGKINISACRDEQQILIVISNTQTASTTRRQGNHMAIENIRQRLKFCFAEKASLELKDDGNKFKVSLVFPYKKKPYTDSHKKQA